jgi:nicotinamidase-related amidase
LFKGNDIVVKIDEGAKKFFLKGLGKCEELIEYLIDRKIKEIDLCGTKTELCISALWFNLVNNGIPPNILYNYCFTSQAAKDFHKNQMKFFEYYCVGQDQRHQKVLLTRQ